jgi:transcription antitermination factor NusG
LDVWKDKMTNISTAEELEWNAIYTRHQHEKSVAQSLTGRGFETFLPTYTTVRGWTDRKKMLSLPLFPCYVFVRTNLQRRSEVVSTPSVHSMVMFAGRPAPVPDLELEAIRRAVESGLPVVPHPFLQCGDWVRVTSGPLIDVEGILIRRKTSSRLVLSTELVGRSIALEIDAFSVEPIQRRSERLPLQTEQHPD